MSNPVVEKCNRLGLVGVPLAMEQVFVRDNPKLDFVIREKFTPETISSYPALTDKDQNRLLELADQYSNHRTVFHLELERVSQSVFNQFYSRGNGQSKSLKEITELFALINKALGIDHGNTTKTNT
jgi:hypothetical protein